MRWRLLFLWIVLVSGGAEIAASDTALGQTTNAADSEAIRQIELELEPAAEPVPVFRYRLLPPSEGRTPGNAATEYYRAVVALRATTELRKQEQQFLSEAGEAAEGDVYQKVPREKLLAWIKGHERPLQDAAAGARREFCDWDLRLQDLRGMRTLTYTLEEFQEMRTIVRVLDQRTRLELEDGKFDAAADSLQTSFQIARDLAQPPSVICGLVGVATGNVACVRVEQWISTPHSPNLYWSLTTFPRPLVSMQRGLLGESTLPERLIPMLKDAETATRSPEQWKRELVQAVRNLQQLDDEVLPKDQWKFELAVMGLIATVYPQAKAELLEAGYDRERLETMPAAQVVAIHASRTTRRNCDELIKASYLPYPEALAWSDRFAAIFESGSSRLGGELLPVTRVLLPAQAQVIRAEARLERQLAALRVIEAIRLHLAASKGQLPASLDEVKIVPVPDNPVTGKPFPYSLRQDGGTSHAVLEVPASSREPGQLGKRYVLKVRKS